MALSKCRKSLYSLFCVLLFIADITVIVLTSCLIYNLVQYVIFLPSIIFLPQALIITLNIIQFFGFWNGIYGIIQENKTSILILCTIIILNSVLNIFIGLWTINIRDDMIQDINDIMGKSFTEYTKHQYKKEEWNFLQMKLKCCGTEGPMSFSTAGADYVPIHCCNSTNTIHFSCEGGEFYKNGCSNELNIFAKEHLYYFIYVVFAIVVMQILSIAVFCHLKAILVKRTKPTSNTDTEPLKKTNSTP